MCKCLVQKSGVAERDKVILGARAPSPAMSAKRENNYSVKGFEIERANALFRGRGRPRSQY
ncbi:MAG TPA: hypothetical protein DC054_02410 [Blastocatellia bacterium]|nr:hypothetical protein [Blastocatellia bacterium]